MVFNPTINQQALKNIQGIEFCKVPISFRRTRPKDRERQFFCSSAFKWVARSWQLTVGRDERSERSRCTTCKRSNVFFGNQGVVSRQEMLFVSHKEAPCRHHQSFWSCMPWPCICQRPRLKLRTMIDDATACRRRLERREKLLLNFICLERREKWIDDDVLRSPPRRTRECDCCRVHPGT